jgi:hypothetical protein
MKTVVGLFDTYSEAQSVASDLAAAGVTRDNVSVIANNSTGEYSQHAQTGDANDGAAVGATTGTVVGGTLGILAGLGAFAIPGIGPVIAAGPLLAGLAGAGVGALAGGLVGALVDAGIPEEDAHYYYEGVRRGGTLVTAAVQDADADRVSGIMSQHGAIDIKERSTGWQERGYTGYDPNAAAYTADEIAREREYYR